MTIFYGASRYSEIFRYIMSVSDNVIHILIRHQNRRKDW